VKTSVDERLRHEATAFVFRFACEDCAHAVDDEKLRCSLGYPAAPRREALSQADLAFCKEFELGDP
jgi:hypothetical protein